MDFHKGSMVQAEMANGTWVVLGTRRAAKEGIDFNIIKRSRMVDQNIEVSNFNEKIEFSAQFLGLREFSDSA